MKKHHLEIGFGIEHIEKSFTSSYKKKIGPLKIRRLPSDRSAPQTYGLFNSKKAEDVITVTKISERINSRELMKFNKQLEDDEDAEN